MSAIAAFEAYREASSLDNPIQAGWSGGFGFEIFPLSSARALELWQAILPAAGLVAAFFFPLARRPFGPAR